MLAPGFHDVPPGFLATVVTHLEMRAPQLRPERDGFALRRVERPDVGWYLELFRRVGAEDWLWFSRLVMKESELAAILEDPEVHVYVLEFEGAEAGLLELDFRQSGACELAFFGLVKGLIGAGAGRWLMNRAIKRAFRPGVTRFHLHTCTMDSPRALDFYRRSGFVATHQQVEVLRDPRLSGLLAEDAAPHVPIFR
ncbi:GNAT family N-acetyltransferase [Rhodobacteraceae bacterium LMO-12]|nr:GNAT family N-acetyltransferase [Rhodobacteraceae bacterium LMO-JJ12]